MAEEELAAGEFKITSTHTGAYSITRTMPDELLRHDISDEELDMLSELRRDNVWEGMWVALGTALGGLPSAISGLAAYLDKEPPRTLDLVDLVQIIIFFGAAGVAVVLGSVCWRKSSAHKPLATQIRERTTRIRG